MSRPIMDSLGGFYLFITFIIVLHSNISASVIEQSHDGLIVAPYKDYGTVGIASYVVPEQAITSSWLFMAFSIPQNCKKPTKIHIYLHAKGIPLVSPNNASFPENFILNHNNNFNITLEVNRHSLVFALGNPHPGRWFSAAFQDPKNDDSIKQKGLHTTCKYAYSARHRVYTADSIQELLVKNGNVTFEASMDSNGTSDLIFKYMLPMFTYHYLVEIFECNGTSSENVSCPVVIITKGLTLPSTYNSPTTNCLKKTELPCVHDEETPVALHWNYLFLNMAEKGKIDIKFRITYQACAQLVQMWTSANVHVPQQNETFNQSGDTDHLSNVKDENHISMEMVQPVTTYETWNSTANLTFSTENTTLNHGSSQTASFSSVLTDQSASCIGNANVDMIRSSGRFFRYFILLPSMRNYISLTNWTMLYSFKLDDILDIGGTLKFSAKLLDSEKLNNETNVSIELCLQHSIVPVSDEGVLCRSPSVWLHRNKTSFTYRLPFPEYGHWYLAVKRHCHADNNSICSNSTTDIQVILASYPCIDGECGPHGSCRYFTSYMYQLSGCRCWAGWQGFACQDGRHAKSHAELIASVLLLTLSNLFFMPAIIIAVKRAYYVEALVFLFNMFFSGFYHACDQTPGYDLCIIPYDQLSFCDFLGSISSFWVTILCMAKLKPALTGFLHALGFLLIALGADWDRHGLLVFLVPVLTALSIMIISWGVKMYRTRSLYPSKKRYLFHVLPGILLAGIGLILFAFIETDDNYFYVHSAWHVLVSLSIICILPSKSNLKTDDPLLTSSYNLHPPAGEDVANVNTSTARETAAHQPLVDFME